MKEFAARLKNEFSERFIVSYDIMAEVIDKIVKEMEKEENV